MDIKEVKKEYCSRCTFYKYECGFITRGLQDKCVQLSDYVDGYERGYEQAKKEMMTKAIDVEVKVDAGGYPYIPQMELYDYYKDEPLAKEGDKYNVILIKED